MRLSGKQQTAKSWMDEKGNALKVPELLLLIRHNVKSRLLILNPGFVASCFAMCDKAIKVSLGCASARQPGQDAAVSMWNFLLVPLPCKLPQT